MEKDRHLLYITLVIAVGLFMALGATPAIAQGCSALTPLDCATSSACTLEADAEAFSRFQCRPTANQCESGFQQLIVDPEKPEEFVSQTLLAQNCEAKTGCSYVESGNCYCPPIGSLNCLCSGGTPPTCRPSEQTKAIYPNGRFIIVAARRASDVAQTSATAIDADIVGNWISFDESSLSAEDLSCDSWEISTVEAVANLEDPILADVMVAPLDSPNSSGDARELTSFEYICEGEKFISVTKIDDRVVVIPWNNSATYLIAEIPLDSAEIIKFQQQLISMKYYDGETTGELDGPTIFAASQWSNFRIHSDEDYHFERPAITQNLLDTLDIFELN